ncbi:GtrA family protein [Pantoea ananatis]|uniref:GtrA family protein n=1 Tax=Pantoea ananas TaxID=553 RepID=UPI001B30379E|nr:GtrA family protein [Pantoea ananatis]
MQFIKFCMVGTVGFITDSLLLLLFSEFCNIYFSRLLSFSVALYITWLLNSAFTFSSGEKKTFLKYVLSSLIGGTMNYLAYVMVVRYLSLSSKGELMLAVGVGSIVGLAFNFTISKFFVFKAVR